MTTHLRYCALAFLLSWAVIPHTFAEEINSDARQVSAFTMPVQQRPAGWTVLTAGDLGAIFNRKDDGIELLSLCDLAHGRQLLAAKPLPLFTLALRNVESKEHVYLTADAGWQQVEINTPDPAKGTELHWQSPQDQRLGQLRVTATATLDTAAGAIRWTLKVDNPNPQWNVRQVVFPRVALDATNPELTVFIPRGPGQLRHAPWPSGVFYSGMYPVGWIVPMQFLAVYDPQSAAGLYFAIHDPQAATKGITLENRPEEQAIVMLFDVPAENMDVGGNEYKLPGEAVWQVLHGDWFDAAMIYRAWVRKNAAWWPKLGAEGREDTPLWMRELPVWLCMHGNPEGVVPAAESFAATVGVPVGVHWYSWHKIPFDNDYPHYFPVKEGLAEAVARLQAKQVYVMPYINGRLWDTRDQGLEDFEFSRVALPAATKNEEGQPYIESYESKESDGSPVRLAVMCPATELWQQKVRQTVARLFGEIGVRGVYIDQVAAATPVLCFDRSHGHPTGGGHWWVESYQKMIDAIRREMPADRMLTTECNAEPFVKNFDGYLTWHWGYDGQVPAFPAVYGGAIQMFGRAYRGDELLSFCMRAGQQFVFGEQIGWFGPDVVNNPDQAAYLKQVVGLRYQFRRYFYAGEMARPPNLAGEIPTVRADWKWDNPGWVTTDAVMTGAWMLPNEQRCILLFTNVSDQPTTVNLHLDAADYGISAAQIKVTPVTIAGAGESFQSPSAIQRDLTLPPRSVLVWEMAYVDP